MKFDENIPINAYVQILYKFKDSISNIHSINQAIETGTHTALTTRLLALHFDKVFTVEKYPENNPYGGPSLMPLYESIRKTHPNIEFYKGDSPQFLEEMFSKYPNETFFIFLDAHAGQNTCVLEELKAIKQFSKNRQHVILIDDCNLLGWGNWPTQEQLKNVLLEINKDYKIVQTDPLPNGVFQIGAWI